MVRLRVDELEPRRLLSAVVSDFSESALLGALSRDAVNAPALVHVASASAQDLRVAGAAAPAVPVVPPTRTSLHDTSVDRALEVDTGTLRTFDDASQFLVPRETPTGDAPAPFATGRAESLEGKASHEANGNGITAGNESAPRLAPHHLVIVDQVFSKVAAHGMNGGLGTTAAAASLREEGPFALLQEPPQADPGDAPAAQATSDEESSELGPAEPPIVVPESLPSAASFVTLDFAGVWPALDVSAFTGRVARFLERVEQEGRALVAESQRGVSLWIIAVAAGIASCEIGRRQLRRRLPAEPALARLLGRGSPLFRPD